MQNPPQNSYLRARWDALCRGQDAAVRDDAFRFLEWAYAEPHRHYHTFNHIEELVRLGENLEWEDADAVAFTDFYHDAILRTDRDSVLKMMGKAMPGNEEQSALLARDELPKLDVAPAKIQRVMSIIRMSEMHEAPSDDADARQFLDKDKSILGQPSARYRAYALEIRREFADFSNVEFAKGRADFLSRTLGKLRIFLTDHFEAAFGAQARANMEEELSHWQSDPTSDFGPAL